MRPTPALRSQFEQLEARETPAVLVAQSFESPVPSGIPTGWSAKTTTPADGFTFTKLTASHGSTSLALLGSRSTDERLWVTDPQPADAGVSLSLRSDGPAIVRLFARGQWLAARPSYLAAEYVPGGTVNLIEVQESASRTVATVKMTSPVFGPWLRITLQPVGLTATARVQRLDTGAYLDSQGNWTTTAVDALQGALKGTPVTGLAGIARVAGGSGSGMAFVDDFQVTSPPPVAFSESFNALANGILPNNWKKWTNDGTTGFATGLTQNGSTGFLSTGSSATAARVWFGDSASADVQVSASIFASSLAPSSVLARGVDLDTTTPTYYAATLSRGISVKLTKVVNGVETVLGELKSKDYVSSTWIRLTLVASGNQLGVMVKRLDKGTWLTRDGSWSSDTQVALTLSDTSITSNGKVGLARGSRIDAATLSFDDVEVAPASTLAGPQLSVVPSTTGTFTGTVTLRVTSDGTSGSVTVDGKPLTSITKFPSDVVLDSRTLADGAHVLVVTATNALGIPTTSTLNFISKNATVSVASISRPTWANKLPSIRIAQLAYDGTPLDAAQLALLQSNVDLVIPNPKYLDRIDQVSSSTPQIIYTNISNIYQTLLTSWLNFADATGSSREAAFYHVATATPYTGSSPSSREVDRFWSVIGTKASGVAVDLTSAAWGGQTGDLPLWGSGSALAISSPDRFRELNVTLKKAADTGWNGQWEYVSAVDANGNPTAWTSLKISDGTRGFSQSGQIMFDPPQDWVPSRVGSDRLYTLRFRTTAGTDAQAPVFLSVKGRDYVNARGTNAGVIPAFDSSADKDGDGYLNDTEYASRASGKDARFVSESRLFYPNYGPMRFVTNPSSDSFRNWVVAYHRQVLATYPKADGVFLDNQSGKLPFGGVSVVESTSTYSADAGALTAKLSVSLSPKLVFSNTTGGGSLANSVTAGSSGAFEEFALRPTDVSWSGFNDMRSLVQQRLASDSPTPYLILDSYPGSFAVTDARLKSSVLAYYYLLADPKKTFLMLFGGYSPAADWTKTWIPAVTVDAGTPTSDVSVLATGNDPQNGALEYRVFARSYSNSLVLFKPRSYKLGVGTGTTDDATATTHNLGGSYRQLNADGTLGPVVTQVTLRNGEGVTLMRVS